MKIGCILPSRGMVFSRTMESVFNNIKNVDIPVELYMAHDLPLPDCFNVPLQKALDDDCDLIWFVEEDMIFPDDTLKKMIDDYINGHMAISTEYADRRTGKSLVTRNYKGKVLYSGMGCMLLDRKIIEKIGKPYLRKSVFWILKDNNNKVLGIEPHLELTQKGYGTQDVWLSWNITNQGHEIYLNKAKVGHMQLMEKSKDCLDNGQHTIKTVYITET